METRRGPAKAPPVDTPRHRALASDSRARILNLVRAADAGMTAAEVARASGLHPSTVRAHLDQLTEADLLVREPDRHGTPGRPAWRYRLGVVPEPARGLYRELAGALVNHLARAEDNPKAAGERAGRDWGRHLARAAEAAGAGQPGSARRRPTNPIDGVVGVLDRLGFTSDVVRRDDDHAVLHLRTCPFLELVAVNPDVVCGLHLGVVRGALGGLGASTAGTALEPFGVDGACVLRLGAAGPEQGKPRR
jgi:predicted ArsR family transcriptional regulator